MFFTLRNRSHLQELNAAAQGDIVRDRPRIIKTWEMYVFNLRLPHWSVLFLNVFVIDQTNALVPVNSR